MSNFGPVSGVATLRSRLATLVRHLPLQIQKTSQRSIMAVVSCQASRGSVHHGLQVTTPMSGGAEMIRAEMDVGPGIDFVDLDHDKDFITTSIRLLWLRTAEPPVPRLFPVCVEALGELGLLAEPFALPVEDVDGYGDHERKTGENGRSVFKIVFLGTNVLVEGLDQEVSSEAIATTGGCRVYTIRRNHVINRAHADRFQGSEIQQPVKTVFCMTHTRVCSR
ncbi:hypothetical protein KC349_g14 [Hortaea werneckii]|nr:hypothetical protein KC349_g14 [Hortaea werneckii]